MRKIIAIAILTVLVITAGCSGGDNRSAADKSAVVVTTNALYEITTAVGGSRVSVTCLLSGGEEIHHFEPTAKDAGALADAALIIYNGLGLDDWASGLSGGTPTLAAAEGVSLTLDGDPHIWLSPARAVEIAFLIRDKLTELDPDGGEEYFNNYHEFAAELWALSDEYAEKFADARLDTFVTGHAALGYLAEEFGLTQKSVSDVFSTSEPTAKQLRELTDFCVENGIKYVLSESAAPRAVSETLANECGAQVLSVYMLESDDGGGLSFLERIKHNLEAVLTALE